MTIYFISSYLAIGLVFWLIDLPHDIRRVSTRASKYRFGFLGRLAFHCILHGVILAVMLAAWPGVSRTRVDP
jgi:hypothetical protein